MTEIVQVCFVCYGTHYVDFETEFRYQPYMPPINAAMVVSKIADHFDPLRRQMLPDDALHAGAGK